MAPFRSRTYRECEVGLHGRVPENRRQRWAERENTRRQATHVAQMSRWQRIGAELEDLFRISHGEPPHTVRWPAEEVSTPASTAPWFVPAPDERVLCRTPGVWMVEADQPPGEPTPGFGGYSALAMAEMADAASSEDGAGEHLWVPGGYRPVESGWVTVTDQRVVFQASGVWEWPFERLLLIEHSRTEPVTMLHVSGSESVYGLRYAGVWASAMRFALSSAVAGYADDGAGFRAALRADRQQHAAERPPTPPTADPAQAPARASLVLDQTRTVLAWWLDQQPRWQALQVVGVLAAITVLLLAPGWGNSTDLAARQPAVTPQPSVLLTSPPEATDNSTRFPEPSSALPSSTASTHPASPSQTGPQSSADTQPTTVRPTDLCGAPTNPYGYNLCGEGSPVTDWEPGVCSYFTCAADFGTAGGHLVQCGDHTLSTSLAPGRGCAQHRGVAHEVFGP